MKSGRLLDDFVWKRARGGYAWKEVGAGLLLVPVAGKDAEQETYRLGDKSGTGLFLQFAGLEPTPAAFLSFANQFGMLGYPVTVDYTDSDQVHYADFGSKLKAPFSYSVPDLATLPMPAKFKATYSFWKGDPPPEFDFMRRPLKLTGEFFSFKDGESDGRSWLHHFTLINWLINARRGSTAEALESQHRFPAEAALKDAVGLMLDDGLAGRVTPLSLLGSMWLQAALAGNKEYRSCPVCRTPIEISRTGGARTDAVFCSNPCKSKDYRQRQATARSLHNDGVPLRQIAKQIDTNLATVKKWLT